MALKLVQVGGRDGAAGNVFGDLICGGGAAFLSGVAQPHQCSKLLIYDSTFVSAFGGALSGQLGRRVTVVAAPAVAARAVAATGAAAAARTTGAALGAAAGNVSDKSVGMTYTRGPEHTHGALKTQRSKDRNWKLRVTRKQPTTGRSFLDSRNM